MNKPNPFEGMWKYGVDHRGDGGDEERFLAIHVSSGDIKYGMRWIGPLRGDKATMEKLEGWAEQALSSGGYVHLFPADGDATTELNEWAKNWEEEYGDETHDDEPA